MGRARSRRRFRSRACTGVGARRTHIDAGQQSEPCLSISNKLRAPFQMDTTAHKTFSHDAWNKNARIYEIIRTMPFNAALAAGTLSEARFKHYIIQDAHYLIGFGRALALAAAKAPNADRIVQFAKAAEGAIVVERELHDSFFQQYGISPELFAKATLSPACHHYLSF